MLPTPQLDADLTARNTLALRARAARLRVLSQASTVPALAAEVSPSRPLWVLGGGSNVILPEQVPGEVWLMAIRGVALLHHDADAWWVQAGAGESWHDLVQTCVQQGWYGLENLALIPGTVGAAPVQNIGAYGLEVAERVATVQAYDCHHRAWCQFDAEACRFAYRDSRFKQAEPGRWVITQVTFRLPKRWQPRLTYPDLQRWPDWQQSQPTPQAVFQAVCAIRRAKLPDPAVLPNAGSFFKNPLVSAAQLQHWQQQGWRPPAWPQADGRVKVAAAWLIEQAGWKARRLGAVGMHQHHALVLVNYGGATAADVWRLAQTVQADVAARFGVALEVEPVAPAAAVV